MTRLLPAVLLLMLSACATTGPTSYQQAAMTPPRPPPVRPVVNEPHFPAPGATPAGAGVYRGEPLPSTPVARSPNKRILPITDGPAVYAADGAQANADKMPPVFGVPLSYPDPATAEFRRWSDFCTSTLDKTAKDSGTDAAFANVFPQSLRCLASRAYLACAYDLADAGGGGTPDDRTAKAMQAHAKRLVQFNCREGQADPANEAPFRDMVEQWRRGLPERLKSRPRP